MAITRLAVSTPNATTDTLLHTSTRNALVSVIAANTSGSAATIRAWAVPSGAVSASAYAYYAYDSIVPGNNTLETFRFAIEDGDSLYVRSSTSFVSFSLNGIYESNGTSNISVASLSASPTSSVIGDVWVESTNNLIYFWNGSSWTRSYDVSITSRWTKTAAGSETSLSGLDDNSITLAYDVGYEQVYLNGVLLVRNSDYTASTGTSITGLTALTINDIVEIVIFNVATISDTYTQAYIDSTFLTQSSASSTYATASQLTQVEALALLGL